MNSMDSFLSSSSSSAAGFVVAAILSITGVLIVPAVRWTRAPIRRPGRIAAWLVLALGTAGLIGAAAPQRYLSQTRKKFPPPGKMVRVNGRALSRLAPSATRSPKVASQSSEGPDRNAEFY